MTAVINKISVGAGGKHTLSPEERPRRSVNYAHNRSRANTYDYGGEHNKERLQYYLILKRNCCNRIVRTKRQRLQNGLKRNLRAVAF